MRVIEFGSAVCRWDCYRYSGCLSIFTPEQSEVHVECKSQSAIVS